MKSSEVRTKNGKVIISDNLNDSLHIKVIPNDTFTYTQNSEIDTFYSFSLIEEIIKAKGIEWVCDEINREEGHALRKRLKEHLFNYIPENGFSGRRILDFGCGCGASTTNLAKLLPNTYILGIDLEERNISVGKNRAKYYGLSNADYLVSPSGLQLPDKIGMFDFIYLNAVYEHLLPEERAVIIPTLFSIIEPKGVLFISETPYRYNLFEHHTTGLPLINFFSDSFTCKVARKFSRKSYLDEKWKSMLRKGIRGGSPKEIIGILKKAGYEANILKSDLFENSIESWYTCMDYLADYYTIDIKDRFYISKFFLKGLLKAIHFSFGFPYAGYLSLAIQKKA